MQSVLTNIAISPVHKVGDIGRTKKLSPKKRWKKRWKKDGKKDDG